MPLLFFRRRHGGPIVRFVRAVIVGLAAVVGSMAPTIAHAQTPETPDEFSPPSPAPPRPPIPEAPPPTLGAFDFLPFNFFLGAIDTSALLWADSLCPSSSSTICPFGNGGGLFIAYGRRYERNHEIVIGYDVNWRNASELFSSAVLQQIRAEHRWIWSSPRTNFEGIVGIGGGVVVYGERFGISAGGAVVSGSVGGNYYLSPFISLGVLLRLDLLRFLPFRTDDGVLRGEGGVATVTTAGYLVVTFLGRN